MQSLKNFLNNQSIPIVISIMALFIAFGTQDTPCLSANVCSAGSNPEFQNDVSFKSGTINKATLSHDLSQDNQYFLGDSGSSGTSTIALITKDSSNQEKLLKINGGVTVGQSSVSEPGTLRVQTSTSPVLQIYGNAGWQDVSQSTPSPNLYNSFAGDTGSITASSSSETITFKSNDPSLTFDVQGDSVFLNSAGGGGGGSADCYYYAYLGSNYSPFNPNGININTEYLDNSNCYTISPSSLGSEITYTDSTTRVFEFYWKIQFDEYAINTGSTLGFSLKFGGANHPTAGVKYGRMFSGVFSPASKEYYDSMGVICLNQNEIFELYIEYWQNNLDVVGGSQYTYLILKEIPNLSTYAQSQGCTDGEIN